MTFGKRCPRCKTTKPLIEFSRRREISHGRQAVCKACQSARYKKYRVDNTKRLQARHLEREYGLTEGAYMAMYAGQGQKCIICKRHLFLDGPQAGRPHVDHDHLTHKVRGLLCGRCNRGIGMFGDRPDMLRAAACYLEVGK